MPLTQTEAQIQTEISRRVAVFEETRKFAASNSSGSLSNYIARETTAFQDATPGDYSRISDAALRARIRAVINAALSAGAGAAVLVPLLQNYAKVVGSINGATVNAIWPWLYQRFIDNSLSVNSRDLTFVSPAAGSNIGNGVINRLSVDPYAFDIEAVHVEAKKATCERDSNLGTSRHEEEFLFQGATPNIDRLSISGSGGRAQFAAKSARQSLPSNPSFDSLDGSAITSLTSIPGWTVGAELIANYNLDRTNFYRDFEGARDTASLKFLDNGSVTQKFTVNGIKLKNKPYYVQIAYNRAVGSCDGLLWLSVGNASVSVVLSAQSGWNILRLPLNRNLWPQNFAAVAGNDITNIKVQLSGRTTGTLLVDDLIFTEMDSFDGHWYAVVGGSTPFVAGPQGAHDKFTWTDSFVGSDSILQQHFWRIFGRYLPYNKSGAETWADPSV